MREHLQGGFCVPPLLRGPVGAVLGNTLKSQTKNLAERESLLIPGFPPPSQISLTRSISPFLQFYARLVHADSLQTDPKRLRVGQAEHGQREQPQGLPAIPLREGADAAVGSLPRLLHGPSARVLELQLHG